MQPGPQPLKGFLLRIIHLHSLEHMNGVFLSMEARGGIMRPLAGQNDNGGLQNLQLVMQPPPPPDLRK